MGKRQRSTNIPGESDSRQKQRDDQQRRDDGDGRPRGNASRVDDACGQEVRSVVIADSSVLAIRRLGEGNTPRAMRNTSGKCHVSSPARSCTRLAKAMRYTPTADNRSPSDASIFRREELWSWRPRQAMKALRADGGQETEPGAGGAGDQVGGEVGGEQDRDDAEGGGVEGPDGGVSGHRRQPWTAAGRWRPPRGRCRWRRRCLSRGRPWDPDSSMPSHPAKEAQRAVAHQVALIQRRNLQKTSSTR